MKKLTATDALQISHTNAKKMNGVEYKRFVKSIIDTYGLEKNDAFSIIQGNHVLEIVAKYENQSINTRGDYLRQCDNTSLAFEIWELMKDDSVNSLYAVERWMEETYHEKDNMP